MKPAIIAAAISLIALPALAEDQLISVDPPAERPYPYEILGIQPGDDLDAVMQVFTERRKDEPRGESEAIRVQSPDGRVFEFTHEVQRKVGGLDLRGRMAEENYQESLSVKLATDVLNQTPMTIKRSMRLPSGELPEALALRAQIEEAYGPPSQIDMDNKSGSMSLIYAWGEDGFIPDLDAQREHEITFIQSGGREQTGTYRPCVGNQAYSQDVEYRFQHPRQREIMPGCVAMFRISHSGKPGTTSISFSLTDYELARINTAETDSQIIEAITGEQEEVEASDMDL